MKPSIAFLFVSLLLASSSIAQHTPPQWMTQGPYLGNETSSFEIPVQVMASKIYVEVELGGKPRRFVFDTGSPSMIDKTLAQELGLQVVGKSKGQDSHGNIIESNIVQTSINIGGTIMNKVPMFAADFAGSTATNCFIGDGVLGSELLPLGAWQIDLNKGVIRFNTDVTHMPSLGHATKTQLHSFGYTHTPFLDVQFARRARSKAMFDTGSPAYFAISTADLEGARNAKGVGNTNSGFGSAGGSLGGQAANADQLQVELKALAIDNLKLGRVGAIQRELSPSLIGAAMLKHFVVTLDIKSEAAYFNQYADGGFSHPSFGFSLAFEGEVYVAAVWDNSPAQAAGIRPGLRFTEINGVKPAFTCQGIQQALNAMQADELNLVWATGSATLSRKTSILEK
ncbi:MAG: aspartyl protease family protein [Bacteroidota bacterium]